ncbi:hypothetical protein [Paenibacillus alginolyticus]|uniref:Uncharacterized protein n=1 Tax=Paenibacillus alginolyticus TaxID=59839 RepID=A0ABT4G7D0_9BACL|nr:hypothetical protein [Paenibacillus alginolyticus]MCY9692081.1 hypothetical protein [Paenibacillus alginolyticus]MEC0147846.1 hypothetical protein [Paenibacillus alginolyticus]
MIRKLTSISFKQTGLALLLTGSFAAAAWVAPAAHAASEGIYISNSSYFTLNQASLSSSSLQFSVLLHNGESQSIDFNQYGVRVTDQAGHSYTAKLSEKKSASVLPGQDQSFRFYANLPAGETADQLKVDVFRWDFSKADFMNHLGDLPVSSVVQEGQVKVPEQIINLHALDSTLSNDASVAFQLGQSVRVTENGKWYMYTQVSAKNLGSSSVKLPSGLQVRLVDANGLKYTATVASGSDTTFLPNQSDTMTLKTLVSRQMPTSGLTLEYYYLNQSEDVSLGTLSLNTSLQTAALGTKQAYAGQQEGEQVTVKANTSTYSIQADGVHVQTVVTLSNEGEAIASVPSFSASYQFGDAGTSVVSTDNAARSGYLAPKETATYYFNATLPTGVDPNAAQLVLWQMASTGSSSGSSSTASTSSGGAASGTATTGSGAGASASSASTSNSSGAAATSKMPVAVFLLKGASEAQSGFTTAVNYELGSKLIFNNNAVVNKNLDVSLMELHAHENDDLGYKTAIAKYKITNNGTSTLALPELQNELIDSKGNTYTGSRQSAAATQITPGSSYVVSYSYLLPNKAQTDDETFALNMYDDKSVSEGNVSVGTYRVALQKETESDTLALYPFSLKVNDSSISWLYNSGTYSYQLNLDLDITHEDQVIIDSNFSKIEFDMVDSLGRIVGTQTATLTGTGKLTSGKQKVIVTGLKNEQVDSGVVVNMYEVIETPNGTAKRLIKQFH